MTFLVVDMQDKVHCVEAPNFETALHSVPNHLLAVLSKTGNPEEDRKNCEILGIPYMPDHVPLQHAKPH
jgi:hypothetical protein